MKGEKTVKQGLSSLAVAIVAVNLRLHFFIIGLFFFCILSWSAEAAAFWMKRYNSQRFDVANAIAVDSSGNVYVTGESGGAKELWEDYATIKYDTNGNRNWVNRFNSPGYAEEDAARAIAVDSNGNVYVTGYVHGWEIRSDGCSDYGTIKYDTNGKRLWVKTYDGMGYEEGDDLANAIAVDSSGNVYVTGDSQGITFQDWDYATVKYDTNGNRKWAKRYNGAARKEDSAKAIAVDSNGNVYVTGFSTGKTSASDYVTIKYDTNGNQKWVKRYNGPKNSRDEASGIALDSSGNVYVTGYSFGITSGKDYTTIKYDTNGNQKWVKRFSGFGANGDDVATAIAIDKGGNVYVTGSQAMNSAVWAYATIKYNTNGKQLWVKLYDLSESGANAIALDSNANVYVTGYSINRSSGSWDYATIKYDTNGMQKWVKRYNGSEDGDDLASAIAVDKSGNVYVTGRSEGSGSGYDYLTIKYDTNGN